MDNWNINEIIEKTLAALPEDLKSLRSEFQQNLKSALTANLKKMDLVTREEFDVQVAMLARSRQLLAELEEKVNQLEKSKE